MSYVQTVLADRPAGFWMITAPSGTSETDLSGNGKTATITEATDLIDRGYRPLVTGSSSDIAYRMYSTNHKLSYPAMEAWEANREHIPFTIEMTFQPMDCGDEAILFAPQAASSAYVMDNGLYCVNNMLKFVVSNGSSTSPATLKTQVQKYLEPGRTYHVVAVYDTTKIKLYVDNVLVDSADLRPGFAWSHTTANFITMSNRVTTDSLKAEFIFDGVSFYRQSLSEQSINNHYFMSTPNNSDVDIVNSLGGKIVKINDEDRVKSFDWSGAAVGWNSDDIVLTDTVINDDGSVGLKKIPPMELKNTPAYYGNLLTWDEATTESGSIPSTITPFNCTILPSTTYAAHGQYSVELTGTNASTNLIQRGYIDVEPNTTYTITAEIYSPAASGSQSAKAAAIEYNEGRAQVAYTGPANISTVVDTWTKVTYTITTTATTRYMTPQIWIVAGAIGNKHYIDKFCVTRGSNTAWIVPRFSPTLDASGNFNGNLVGSYFASGRGSGNWITYNGHPAPTQQTTYFLSGNSAPQMTTNNTGDILFGSSPSTGTAGFFRVTPGKTYTVTGSCYAPESSKNFNARVRWHTASGTYISYTAPSSVATVANSWVTCTGQVTPPAGAAYASVAAWVQAPSNGVTYRYDNFGIFEGVVTSWSEPVFNLDEIDLSDSRYAIARDAGKYIGKNSGGFGFFADFTATENDHVGEQALAALSNTVGDSVIEIVKKADKALYLRYKYLNTAGDLTTTEASWGAISSLLATTPYIYVEWGNGLLSLYVNSTSSPAQIAFDNGVKAPQFDERSYFHLGAGADAFRPWNNNFKWLKFYSEMQDPSMFILNQTSVNGFTAKLGSNLNVSQAGKVQITTLTGSDGTEPIDNSRISWTPQNSNISVASGTVDRVNLLTYNQATIETDTAGWYARDATPTLSRSVASVYSGTGSLAVTCPTAALVAAGTAASSATPNPNYNQIPVKAGVTYTASAKARAGSTTRTTRMYILWYTASGGYSAVSGTGVSTTSGAWQDITVSATAPATAAYAGIAVAITSPTAGEVFYFDNLSLYEGTSTTWTPPLRPAVSGHEAQYLEQFATEPVQYLVDATLTTDDSYYNPVKLDDLKIEDFVDSTVYAENGFDELVGNYGRLIYPNNISLVRQTVNSGFRTDSSTRTPMLYVPVDDTANVSVPTDGSGATTAGPVPNARTIEFWVYPETQGYCVFYDSPTEYSMRYHNSGGFTVTGFSRLYVDGVLKSNGNTMSNWYNHWHHIVLTNDSVQLDLRSSYGDGINLLSYDQATVELSAANHGAWGGTVVRSNEQAAQGTYSLKTTATQVNQMNIYAIYPTSATYPAKPGQQYTITFSARAQTVTTMTLASALFHLSEAGTQIASGSGSTVAIPNNAWVDASYTFTAPTDKYIRIQPFAGIRGTFAINDVVYIDKFGLWEGSSTTWTQPPNRLWFGYQPLTVYLPTARFQNISYYPQSFTAEQALANYKAYLGDVTTGSFNDAPGSRTIADVSPKYYSNIWNSQTISV